MAARRAWPAAEGGRPAQQARLAGQAIKPGQGASSPAARWIWAADMFGTDEAFCRCTEGHDEGVGMTTSGHGQFHIRVDDQSTLFVNGKNIGESQTGRRALVLCPAPVGPRRGGALCVCQTLRVHC